MHSNNNDQNNDKTKGSNIPLYLISIGSVALLVYLIVSQYMQNH